MMIILLLLNERMVPSIPWILTRDAYSHKQEAEERKLTNSVSD
ncbi:hypothetical protein [Paenibacillus sp. 19GGS1-52]|nr:hypothetical protein [Paenibacillus sp. 19GGS1-52]